MGRACDSFDSIFGVVPDDTSAWKPEMAPHMIVMKTNGKTLPGTMGPPPPAKVVSAGILSSGLTTMVPMISAAMVPIFRYDER